MRLAAKQAMTFAFVVIAAAGPAAFAGLHILKPGQAAESAQDGDPGTTRDGTGLPDVLANRCLNEASKTR